MSVRSRVLIGFLVVGVFIAGGFYLRKAIQWTDEFDPFTLHAARNSGGSPSEMFLDPVVPLILAGSFDGGLTTFSTVIQVTSTGVGPAPFFGEFFVYTGASSPVVFRLERPGAAASTFTGSLPQLSLPTGQTAVITTQSEGGGTYNWGQILVGQNPRNVASGSIAITTIVENRTTATGGINYRLHIDSTSFGAQGAMLPRFSNSTGMDVGFIMVNPSTMRATVTAALRGPDGAAIATRNFEIPARNLIAYYVPHFFPMAADPSLPNNTNIVFDTNDSAIVGIALASGAGQLFSYPMVRLR